MDALLIFFTMLVPSISFYDDYIEHGYNIRYNHYSTEERLNTFSRRKPALLESSEYWLRSKRQKKKIATVVTKEPKDPSLKMTFFPRVENKQINATKISETKYPWIARVFHSPSGNQPYLCSAACIEERIFLTAARCIVSAKVASMNVLYQGTRLKPIAIVVPSKPTKQMFDDIGLIVVDSSYKKKWQTINVYDKLKRTDKDFKWFGKVPIFNGTAVGYVAEKEKPEIQSLYEINVYISNYLCNTLYAMEDRNSYFVPCFHTCSLEQRFTNRDVCKKYLGGEGHIVLNEEKSKQIVGVATWALGYHRASGNLYHMPIGMSVPNSDSFNEDLQCARKIRNAKASSKSFANLC